MALPVSQHFYFRSKNGRYRAHIGTKGALVMASCQGVARLKMDTQKLMVERKHFGLKFHLLPNSREMVELLLFTNRAEVKEVRVKVAGEDLPTVSEKQYRAGGEPPAVEPGAATLVQPPPGTGLAADLRPPSKLPVDPEKDDVLDRLAVLTGSGKHPPVGRISEPVTLPAHLPPAEALRIDPAMDIVPPLPEDAPTPAHTLPAVPPPADPARKTKPARSGQEPAAKSGVQRGPGGPSGSKVAPAAATPAAKSGLRRGPGGSSGSKVALSAPLSPAKSGQRPGPAGSRIEPAASPPAAKSPPPAASPAAAPSAGKKSGVEPAVKINLNAVKPDGDLKVPEGLDDLLDLDDNTDNTPLM